MEPVLQQDLSFASGCETLVTLVFLISLTDVKSIDVYLGTCFVMVFASLLGKYNNDGGK